MSKLTVISPADGKVIMASKINDATFSANMMGEGFGLIASDSKMCAPIDGTIILISGHAFAIRHSSGVEVLVHMGIDTVGIEDSKKAEIFKYSCKVGDKVTAGKPVVKVD
jgi:glucose-specific phosphotransferase system IIA component